MRIAKRAGDAPERVEMMMTPLIDVVFQQIIFFMLSLEIRPPEGDFSVKMPLHGPPTKGQLEPTVPPIPVRIAATESGAVKAIQLGNRFLGKDFQALEAEIRNLLNDDAGPGAAGNLEVELACDYGLHYEHAIEAISAVSGYTQDGKTHRLIEQIRFAPPQVVEL